MKRISVDVDDTKMWILVPKDISSVQDLINSIKQKHKYKNDFNITLNGIIVPLDESHDIIRDGECIKLSPIKGNKVNNCRKRSRGSNSEPSANRSVVNEDGKCLIHVLRVIHITTMYI